MFGKGVYFSDCATKAFNYVHNGFGYYPGGTANVNYILLCEVALGTIKTYKNAQHNAHLTLGDANSVIGEGSHVSKTAK